MDNGFFSSMEEENRNPTAEAGNNDNHLLHRIRSGDAIECFGGYLFRDTDSFNHPILCFAVPNMEEVEVRQANEWYNQMGRLSHLGFLHRTTTPPQTVANYTVFAFEINQFDRTLAELHREGKLYKQDPDQMMRCLVQFLAQYQQFTVNNYGSYLPLCSLSLSTLIMGENGTLRLLPLRAHNNDYPIEIPNEVTRHEGSADERSDLYSAAYVAVEIYSANRGDGRLAEPNSPTIVSCLKTMQDWRPSLAEVRSQLQSHHAPHRDTPAMDSNGNRKQSSQHPSDEVHGTLFDAVKKSSFFRGMAERFKMPEEPETPMQVAGTYQPDGVHQKQNHHTPYQATENGTFKPTR